MSLGKKTDGSTFPPPKSLTASKAKRRWATKLLNNLAGTFRNGIIYPTGGGVGLLGMWKAFDEMEQLGFIGPERPNMICVQSAGCAPIVKAWDEGRTVTEMWPNALTLAAGVRVPKPYGDYLILDILKKSGGLAVAATDAEILEATRHWAKVEGIFAAPEGAASLVAYQKLLASEFFSRRGHRSALQHRIWPEVSRRAGHEKRRHERCSAGATAGCSRYCRNHRPLLANLNRVWPRIVDNSAFALIEIWPLRANECN